MNSRLVHRLAPVVFLVIVVAAWQLYASTSGISDSSLPEPAQVASSLWGQRATLASNALVTITEIALGYLVAIVLGLALATAINASRLIEDAVYPWLAISQMVPIPAIAPIIVVWTGFDIRPKLIVIALVSFFPIAVNAIDGFRSTDPDLLSLLRTMGAGRGRRFRSAQFPAALPFIFSGLKVAAALAVIGAVFAEWVGSSEGLGYLILSYNNQAATADMFAAVVVLALIGVALFALVNLLERAVLPWHHGPRRRAGVAARL